MHVYYVNASKCGASLKGINNKKMRCFHIFTHHFTAFSMKIRSCAYGQRDEKFSQHKYTAHATRALVTMLFLVQPVSTRRHSRVLEANTFTHVCQSASRTINMKIYDHFLSKSVLDDNFPEIAKIRWCGDGTPLASESHNRHWVPFTSVKCARRPCYRVRCAASQISQVSTHCASVW